MIGQVLSELRKMRSTRTNLGLLAGMILLILLGVLLNGLIPKAGDLANHNDQHALLSAGTAAALFASLIGVMAITSEYRHGTIRPTFVVTPRRTRVVAAKVIASLLMGVGFGVLGLALSFGVGYAILAGRGIDFALDRNHVILLVVGTLLMTALWAALGVGLGALVKNQVLAIIALIAWVMVVDSLLMGLVPGVGRFMPTAASDSLTAGVTDHILAPLPGGLLLVGYAALLSLGGAIFVARRDVT